MRSDTEHTMQDTKKFEDYMAELDDITKRLTQEKLPMDTMVELYERGMGTAKKCMDMLKSYSGRVEELRQGVAELFEGQYGEDEL